MKYFDWMMTVVSILVIMCVAFLQLKTAGAVVSMVLAFGWLIRYAWSKEDV